MSTRLALPDRRNHVTRKVKIASQRRPGDLLIGAELRPVSGHERLKHCSSF